MDKQKAPWKLGSKQIPLYYLVTLDKSVCFHFSRSYSLSPFLNNLKFLLVSAKIITTSIKVLKSIRMWSIKMCSSQNQLSILISIISTIFVIARPVYWNKWKLKWYKNGQTKSSLKIGIKTNTSPLSGHPSQEYLFSFFKKLQPLSISYLSEVFTGICKNNSYTMCSWQNSWTY